MIDSSDLYNRFMVKLALRNDLCGGTPKNPDVIKDFVVAKTGHDDEQTKEQVADIEEHIQTVTEKCWNGFLCDDTGLYLPTRNVKAMLKECASVLGITKTKRGSKQILQHGFEVKGEGPAEQRVYLGVKEPTGYHDQAIHVMTAQGPRTALKRVDYVSPPRTIQFQVWCLKTQPAETRHIGRKELEQMFALGQENGLGADRSQGYGKFHVIEFGPM